MRTRVAIFVATLLLSVAFFFRPLIINNFSVFFGDSYDGMIELSILQHWYNVFAHGEHFFSTRYFYPYPVTIGYNDSLFIPGIFFTASRLAGADVFLSALIAHVFMKAIGFCGMFVLLRRGGEVRFALALAGSALFTIANASVLQMYHAQLLSLCLIPWLMFLALRAGQALLAGEPRKLCLFGGFFGAGFGLSAFNAFYIPWFFALGLIIYAAVAAGLAGSQARAALWRAILDQWMALAFCALVALFALVPLGVAYLPKAVAGMHHDWIGGPAGMLVKIGTIFNVGGGNLVWGQLLELAASTSKHGLAGGESQVGFPLGLLFAGLAALPWLFRNRKENALLFAMAVSLVVFIALMSKWPGGFTAWYYVYSLVPGANAIRIVTRGLLFAIAPLTFIVFCYLDRSVRSGKLIACIVAFLLIEQVQLHAPVNLDRAQQLHMLKSVGAPPSACNAIFVISARSDEEQQKAAGQKITSAWAMYTDDKVTLEQDSLKDYLKYRHNVDAMFIAEYYNVYTINGFSTFNPPDWNFTNSRDETYTQRVADYAKIHGITKLCGLDVKRKDRWFFLDNR